VLAVRGEEGVLRAGGAGGAHLGGLLTAARRPQGELALALQVRRLLVDRADDDHVAVELLELGIRDRFDQRHILLGGGVGGVSAVRLQDADGLDLWGGHRSTLSEPPR